MIRSTHKHTLCVYSTYFICIRQSTAKPMLCCNRFLVFIHTQIYTHTVTNTNTYNFLHVIGSPVPLSFFLFHLCFFSFSMSLSCTQFIVYHSFIYPQEYFMYGRFLLIHTVFLYSLSTLLYYHRFLFVAVSFNSFLTHEKKI